MTNKPMLSVERELLEEMMAAMKEIHFLPAKYYGSTFGDRVRAILEIHSEQADPKAIGTLHRDCDERIVFESSGEIHIKDGMQVYAEPAAPHQGEQYCEFHSSPDECDQYSGKVPCSPVPPLIATLHENGELIATQATIAQQAKLIELLKAGSQGEPVAWSYCPECGCEELHHECGEHKQCKNCHQEWFSDINYSEVVRGNLKKLKSEQLTPVAVVMPEGKPTYDRDVIRCPPAAKGLPATAYCAAPAAPSAAPANPLTPEDLEILREYLRETVESARESLAGNAHWPCNSAEEYEEFEKWRSDKRATLNGVKP